jgi:murein DD-endopeptidase MepM/ murein hydrolase activator NlpD
MPGRMRKLFALVVLCAVPLALWGVLPLSSAGAPSPGQIQRKITRKESQIAGHRAHERVLTTDITALSKHIRALQGDITRLQARQTRLETDLAAKRLQLARLQGQLRAERLKLARLKARLAAAKKTLAKRLVQIYEDGEPDIIAVLLESDGFEDLLERGEFLRRISRQDTRIITAVKTAKAATAASATRLAGLERKQAKVTATIAGEVQQVAVVKGALVDRRAGFASARAKKTSALVASRSQRVHLEADVATLRKQQEAIQARLAAASGTAPAGPIHAGSGGLIWPVNGPITSPFCESRPWEACHPGIDIGVASGTPVRAAASGRVALIESAGASGGYGNFLCIQHSGALSTCYAHLMSFRVSMGQSVSQGQVVAISDCTGRCFGPHLHFEVRINGQVVNPMNYL